MSSMLRLAPRRSRQIGLAAAIDRRVSNECAIKPEVAQDPAWKFQASQGRFHSDPAGAQICHQAAGGFAGAGADAYVWMASTKAMSSDSAALGTAQCSRAALSIYKTVAIFLPELYNLCANGIEIDSRSVSLLPARIRSFRSSHSVIGTSAFPCLKRTPRFVFVRSCWNARFAP